MKSSGFDPAQLDVAAFTGAGASLDGQLPQAGLNRLVASTQAPADGSAQRVDWSAQGLRTESAGGRAETRLHLIVRTSVHRTCQRCLQPVAEPLVVDRTIRFVPGDDEAARLDEELEEDVLALPRRLDLVSLIEDELILALPIVPMHETCPTLLTPYAEASANVDGGVVQRANPFAALAALKKGRPAG